MELRKEDFFGDFGVGTATVLTDDRLVFQGQIRKVHGKRHHHNDPLSINVEVNNDPEFITMKLSCDAAIVTSSAALQTINPSLYKKGDTVRINVAKIVTIGSGDECAAIISDDIVGDSVPVRIGNAPPGTVDIEPGQTYKTPGGCGIIWNAQTNIIIVCEPGGDFWSIAGAPPILTDGAGISQTIPTIGAYFSMIDGSSLIVAAATLGGPEVKSRVLLPGTPVNPTTIAGFDPTQTTVYLTNPVNFSKTANGTLA